MDNIKNITKSRNKSNNNNNNNNNRNNYRSNVIRRRNNCVYITSRGRNHNTSYTNINNNNIHSDDDDATLNIPMHCVMEESRPASQGVPLRELVNLMIFVIGTFEDKDKGVTIKEIKRRLVFCGLIDPEVSLRRALIFGLKKGLLRRPAWAAKAGVCGVYVVGKERAEEQKRPDTNMKLSKNKKEPGFEGRKGRRKGKRKRGVCFDGRKLSRDRCRRNASGAHKTILPKRKKRE